MTCLRSIYSTVRNVSYEIVVVDNASTDGSVEMLKKDFKQVTLIENPQNTGFSCANNKGIRHARGSYILLLNSDIFLKDSAIDNLMQFIKDYPEAAAVGPKVLNKDGTLQSCGFCFPSVLLALIELFRIPKLISILTLRRLFPKYYWTDSTSRKVNWISGCCMLLRRDKLDKIGFLSEDFFMYYEDLEWCLRSWKLGFEIWYCACAEVLHYNSSAPLSNRTEVTRISAKIFYKKTNSVLKGFIITFIHMLFILTRLLALYMRSGTAQEVLSTSGHLKDEASFLKFLVK